jgi:diguanylate cyclase (GGDEF)-like protein
VHRPAVDLLLVICALAFAALTAVAAAIAVWRARATADTRVAEAVQMLASGMHETLRDLAGSIDTSRGTAPPEAELAASLDVDEVAERTLAAIEAIPGVQAAALETPVTVASRGMQPDEAARARIGVPDNDNLRAIEVSYRYRIDDVDGAAALLRAGIVIPLRAEGAPAGSLSAFTRSSGRALTEGELEEVERVAFRAGPALENARRYAEVRALADLDALTGLHNRRHFHELLAREIARAHRYGRKLALIVIDLDDFKAVNDKVGHLAGDAVLAEASERMRTIVRHADIACRVGGDEFAVILPESTAGDAELLAGRIARAIGSRPILNAGTLLLSAGAAELRENDRPNDLFERADDALYRAKELGKARTVLANGA